MYEIIKNLSESLYSALLRVILDHGEALLKKHMLEKNKTHECAVAMATHVAH